jgi:hypothetical protein
MNEMTRTEVQLGIGAGWRPELALAIERYPRLGFVEVIAEDVNADGPLPLPIQNLRERGVAVIPHGVTLGLGGAEPPKPADLEHLARLATHTGAPFVSEHMAWVRAGGVESGHLLPLPRTREALDVLVENVRIATRALPVSLALENIAALFEWPKAEMDEADFLTKALVRTDCLLLLDISNLYANARNHGFDALDFLDRIPLERLAYVHIGGGIERDGLYHDTHRHPVVPEALALLEELCARAEPPGILLERDDDFPPEEELASELDALAAARERGARRRER